jgi:hypothetical protein
MPPFFGPVSSILSLKSNIGSGLVFGGQVTWIANLAHHLGELADFLEALPDDDPLIQAEAGAWRPGRQGWHDRRIREWFDYMAGLPARESGDDSD